VVAGAVTVDMVDLVVVAVRIMDKTVRVDLVVEGVVELAEQLQLLQMVKVVAA